MLAKVKWGVSFAYWKGKVNKTNDGCINSNRQGYFASVYVCLGVCLYYVLVAQVKTHHLQIHFQNWEEELDNTRWVIKSHFMLSLVFLFFPLVI